MKTNQLMFAVAAEAAVGVAVLKEAEKGMSKKDGTAHLGRIYREGTDLGTNLQKACENFERFLSQTRNLGNEALKLEFQTAVVEAAAAYAENMPTLREEIEEIPDGCGIPGGVPDGVDAKSLVVASLFDAVGNDRNGVIKTGDAQKILRKAFPKPRNA